MRDVDRDGIEMTAPTVAAPLSSGSGSSWRIPPASTNNVGVEVDTDEGSDDTSEYALLSQDKSSSGKNRGKRRASHQNGAHFAGLCRGFGRIFFCGVLMRKEVVHLPRNIPMDGKMNAHASLTEGSSESKRSRRAADPGLVSALASRNVVRNQKYRAATFVMQVLYEQFRFFFNLYFLGVALSQFIPALQVGFLFTYIAPLVFVLGITLMKEGYDDYKRYVRDKEANSQRYQKLTASGEKMSTPSSDLRVGDVVFVNAGERVPADMVLLRTTDEGGSVFIRTDQLDGETDWKLRRAVAYTHRLPQDRDLTRVRATLYADRPTKEIDKFIGNFTVKDAEAVDDEETGIACAQQLVEPLSVENTLWANTVVCGGHAVGIVIYTGGETRVAMNADPPKSKVGLVDLEINRISKMLFVLSATLSLVMVVLKGWAQGALQSYVRFVILFSSIIPISLRVNIDMAKTTYSYFMMCDKEIAGTIVRSSFIPEELGRIDFLLSDKTGTLTKNQMEMKEIHLGEGSYGREDLEQVSSLLCDAYALRQSRDAPVETQSVARGRQPMHTRVQRLIEALAVCNNVNVSHEDDGSISYQASSPDEVALVKFAATAGVRLARRSLSEIGVELPGGFGEDTFEILYVFPFTSETKRMGIIVRDAWGRIAFFMKGSDATMTPIVQFSDWLEEECGNLARKGLRTLVVGMRYMSQDEYANFSQRYEAAKRALNDRDASMRTVVEDLECNLELLGLTGVEDKLQEQVSVTLETLRNAGVRVWMLTGDKVETATCIAISSHLFARNANVFTLQARTKEQAEEQFNRFQKKPGACLVIDGESLSLCTDNFARQFIEVACNCPSVVCCRCAPTQKALIVRLLKLYAKKRCAAIGDGGNDVAMIQVCFIYLLVFIGIFVSFLFLVATAVTTLP
jgi:phospholipid-translocating ATPase